MFEDPNSLQGGNKMNNKALESFELASVGLTLFESNPPIKMPDNFQIIDRDFLESDNGALNSLIKCYQEVFGSEDVWSEGAVCSKCGSIISFEKYKSSDKCRCGGEYAPYYKEKDLKEGILKDLDRKKYPSSFCTVMKDVENKEDVSGFCWGFVGTKEEISDRVMENPHVNDPRIKEALMSIGENEKITYFDELGIKKSNRSGLGPVVFLTRSGFETGCRNQSQSALFWTSRKSPIYTICRALGFDDLFDTQNGLTFLYTKNFIPFLKVMQNKSVMRMTADLGRGLKSIELE